MRILFLTNYYPPYDRGGYEQLCAEVAGELVLRGHSLEVLTSKGSHHSDKEIADGIEIRRNLNLQTSGGLIEGTRRHIRGNTILERENLSALQAAIDDFQPDCALVWGMWNMSRTIPCLAERFLPGKVAYYLCDYWPTLPSALVQQWESPATKRQLQLLKALLRPAIKHLISDRSPCDLRFENVVCVSKALRQKHLELGFPMEGAQVIHLGIDAALFHPKDEAARTNLAKGRYRIVYAGRLSPEKGVHTLVQALSTVRSQTEILVTLDLVGSGGVQYVGELQSLVTEYGLQDRVKFRGHLNRKEMADLFRQFDALVFPSEWNEPFARVVLEAMASDLPVIGTTIGGTGEILVEGETGLTFPAGDYQALAQKILRMARSGSHKSRMTHLARKRVVEEFSLSKTVYEIESFLQEKFLTRAPAPNENPVSISVESLPA